jgi:hypothetical protein
MATESGIFVADNLYCEFCDYNAPKKYNYDKHILTARHRKLATPQHLATNGNKNSHKTLTNDPLTNEPI